MMTRTRPWLLRGRHLPIALMAITVVSPGPGLARWTPPPGPDTTLQLPDMTEADRDGNGVEDGLDREVRELRQRAATTGGAAAAELTRTVTLQLVFAQQITQAQLDAFTALGGEITYVFHALAYGWLGRLPRDRIDALPATLGPSLVGVFSVRTPHPDLHDATRRGRVREVWAPGFAGSTLGYEGNTNTTIVFLDTGIDDSHPDLTGRRVWWANYTPSALALPADREGHRTAVAGTALGTGAAFGVGPAPLSFTTAFDLYGANPNHALLSGTYLPPTLLTLTHRALWRGRGTLAVGTAYFKPGDAIPDNPNDYPQLSSPTAGADGQAVHSDTFSALDGHFYDLYLRWTAGIEHLAVVSTASTFGHVGDSYNAFRGVAPGCNWDAGKIF